MSRPTVNDITRAAGVSLATVDRVLNGRPGVRQSTIDRVNAAIDEIGYVRDVAAANLARGRQYRFAFILPRSGSAFVAQLAAAVRAASGTSLAERTGLSVVEVPPEDPHRLVAALRGIDGSRTDGVAILADETPHLRDEVRRLGERGVRVVALVSDLPNTARDHFVGIDNVAAGRTAGVLMGRFLLGRPASPPTPPPTASSGAAPGASSGAIVTLANSMLSREAVERRRGFDEVLVERFPSLAVLPTIEVHDDPATVRDVLHRVLERRGDVVGLYALGTGHRGMIEALRAHRERHGTGGGTEGGGGRGDIVALAHDLTPALRGALEDGTVDAVISQNVEHIVRSAIRVLRAKCDHQPIVASQERIRIEIVLRENLVAEGDAEDEGVG